MHNTVSTITSRDNDRIKRACALRDSEKQRAAAGLFFAEGPKLCLELSQSCEPAEVFATPRALEHTPALSAFAGRTTLIAPHVAEKLAGTRSSQEVFGLFRAPSCDPAPMLASAGRILALEAVQDPGNVGALLRSAAAFGFDGVLLGPGCAAPFSPKVLRASMGAAGRLPLGVCADLPAALKTLGARGVTCLAAALYNARPLDEVPARYPGGLCLVIGSEGQGLSDAAVGACALSVRIPMTDRVESLNAGVAGSILLWHFRGV